MGKLEHKPLAEKDNTFKGLSEADYWALSREDRIAYDRSLKAYRDYNNTIAYAADQARLEGREEGFQEGHEEGFQEGHEEGFQEGHEEGFQEGLQKGLLQGRLQMARTLLGMGVSMERIIQETGLTKSQISKLLH